MFSRPLLVSRVIAMCLPGLGCEGEPSDNDEPTQPEPGPDVEFTVHTPHLDIAPVYEGLLCAGTVAQWEAHTAYLVDLWDLELPRAIPIYLFSGVNADDSVDLHDHCPGWSSSCYSGRSASVYTVAAHAHHEIVHAVLAVVGRPTSPMLESTAIAFEGDVATLYSQVETPPGFLLDKPDYSYSHFIRWLAQAYSPATFIKLYASMPHNADSDRFNEVLQEVLGLSEQELILEYRAGAAYVYPGHSMCTSDPVMWHGDGLFEHSIALDCSDQGTFGASDQAMTMSAKFVVEISEDAYYLLAALDEHDRDVKVIARRCGGDDAFDPDAPAKFGLFGEQFFYEQPLWLTAGLYQMAVEVPLSAEPLSVEVVGFRVPGL